MPEVGLLNPYLASEINALIPGEVTMICRCLELFKVRSISGALNMGLKTNLRTSSVKNLVCLLG